jgi:peptidylprolyl isomerase
MRRPLFLLAILLLTASALAQDGARLRLEIEGKGAVVIRLYPDKAPKAVGQIVKLAKSGFYDGLRFHRADRTPRPYLVQVGDPQSRSGNLDAGDMGTHGTGARIPFEDTGLRNVAGAVGLARLGQDRDSGDSQFYVMLGSQGFLDGNYTVFGQVTDGMEVVRKIEKGDRIAKATVSGA